MPRMKRTPIAYSIHAKEEIFRPRDVVETELASLAREERTPDTRNQNERTFERTNETTNERLNDRTKIRHSFDVFRDQLLSLTEIQAAVFRQTGQKPKIGELVQQAIDEFIQRHRADERSNERTNVPNNADG
jgi:hypothetical protein